MIKIFQSSVHSACAACLCDGRGQGSGAREGGGGGFMAVSGYLSRPGLFATDPASAVHPPPGCPVGFTFPALSRGPRGRAQPRASPQEPRVKSGPQRRQRCWCSPCRCLLPGFRRSSAESLNYSALCHPSLTSAAPSPPCWLPEPGRPLKKSIPSLFILSLSDINLIKKPFVLFLEQMLKWND